MLVWRNMLNNFSKYSYPPVSAGHQFQDPFEYQNLCLLKSLISKGIIFTITYVHPPVYFKSFLGSLWYIVQCKYYVSSCKHKSNPSFTFWNFLELKIYIFDLWLVEYIDMKCCMFFSKLHILFKYYAAFIFYYQFYPKQF